MSKLFLFRLHSWIQLKRIMWTVDYIWYSHSSMIWNWSVSAFSSKLAEIFTKAQLISIFNFHLLMNKIHLFTTWNLSWNSEEIQNFHGFFFHYYENLCAIQCLDLNYERYGFPCDSNKWQSATDFICFSVDLRLQVRIALAFVRFSLAANMSRMLSEIHLEQTCSVLECSGCHWGSGKKVYDLW